MSTNMEKNNMAKELIPESLNKDFGRRDFLKGVGVLVVGFSLSAVSQMAESSTVEGAINTSSSLADLPNDAIDSYIVIAHDGTTTLFTSRVDMGMGTSTGFMQIMAEELDISFSRARIVMGDTGLAANDGGVSGSSGIREHGQKVRRAAASARAALFGLASQRLGVPVSQLTVYDGVVSVVSDATRAVSYAELIAGKTFNVKIDNAAKTKPVNQYKIVGQSIPRVDIAVKLTGQEEYVHDVKLPGMLHARIVRPRGQSLGYSKLISYDESSVADVKGLVKVAPGISTGDRNDQLPFVGVICEREEQAVKAAERLKVIWETPAPIPADLHAELVKAPSTRAIPSRGGDVEAAMTGAARKFEATYKTPFQMHAPFASACAVADVRTDGSGNVTSAKIWASVQNTFRTRSDVGRTLGIPAAEIPDKVQLIWRWGPGSFGSRCGFPVAAEDAAILSKAVGRPVRVQWTRENTHGWEFYGPIMLYNAKAGLDTANRVVAYDFESWGGSSGSVPFSAGAAYTFGRGSANHRYVRNSPARTFFFTGPLRAPEGPQAVFASESFVDELAAAISADPVAFRLGYLDSSNARDARVIDVINAATTKFGWDARPSPNPANASNRTGIVRGRGIAHGDYVNEDSAGAAIVELEVNQSTGDVRLIRGVHAFECGLVVNPECVRLQMEGSFTQGASRALLEEVKNDGFRVSSLDWITYPILTFPNIPKIETVLINRPDQPSHGAGEGATVPIWAAIANAIFDATGARVRQVPFTPERVLEGLNKR